MKVVSSHQMTEIESKAYRDGLSESDFMEEAGNGVALVVHDYAEKNNTDRKVILLCGKGNNAGDAYVAGISLIHLDYEVFAYQTFPISECSTLCKQNHVQFMQEGGKMKEIVSEEEIWLPTSGIIIDGLFGTGFRGKVDDPFASIIRLLNKSRLPIISVDIPSGLDGDTGEVQGESIIAYETAYLGLPKTGFFLRDGWNHVGKLTYVDYGLPQKYIDESDADFILLSPDLMRPLLPPIQRDRHKYQAGLVVGLSGSKQYPGAALLASSAAMSSGAGIVRLLHPKGMEIELAPSPHELIKVPYDYTDVDDILELLNTASGVFIGPGIGLSVETRKLIQTVLPKITKPCVIDADALTILSETGKIKLPEKTILTPHMGEMKRLLHIETAQKDKKFMEQCQKYAEKKKVTLILKGGPTFIFHPGSMIMVNAHGDPGMATAGSGDVLTGILAALLSEGLSTHEAAQLGVFLHGVSGEFAAEDLTSYCMVASDLINHLPDAFQQKNWTM